MFFLPPYKHRNMTRTDALLLTISMAQDSKNFAEALGCSQCCYPCSREFSYEPCCVRLYGCSCGRCKGCEETKQPKRCCCVTSWVLALNTAAAVAHLVAFATLLGFVADWHLVKTLPLRETIVVWEKRNASCKDYTTVRGEGACAEDLRCLDTASDPYDIYSKSTENGTLSLELLILSFSALSFIFQGLRPCLRFSSPQGNLTYLKEVSRRVQRLRWIEYSVSATCMILALSMIVNPNLSFSTAVLVSTSTAATQFCGLVAEFLLEALPLSKEGKKKPVLGRNVDGSKCLLAFVIHFAGWVLQMGVFASVYASFFLSVDVATNDNNSNTEGPPPWVTTAIGGTAVLFGSFGVVQLIDLCDRTAAKGCCTCQPDEKGKQTRCCGSCAQVLCPCCQPHCTKDPGAGFELVYVLLSLTAKLFLSILVASNLFMPN